MLCTNYRLTITFGNLYFTKENFGRKYLRTYKILHAKSNTSTLLSLKVKVKY